jgi:hypothetical protein
MHNLVLINAGCEGDPEIDKFADFLRRKLDNRAQVDVIEMATCTDYGAIPAPLIEKLIGQPIGGLPVVVLNGKVLASGPLPNWMDSLDMIELAMTTPVRVS